MGEKKKKRNKENGWLIVIFTDICVVLDKKMVDVPLCECVFQHEGSLTMTPDCYFKSQQLTDVWLVVTQTFKQLCISR